jgi:hypothetical protein
MDNRAGALGKCLLSTLLISIYCFERSKVLRLSGSLLWCSPSPSERRPRHT